MRRDRVVSVRLTEAEFALLASLGGPTEVLRDALHRLIWPGGLDEGSLRPTLKWPDGSFGNTYPPLMTGSRRG